MHLVSSQMTPVGSTSRYSKVCPACHRTIHPSEIPARFRNSYRCPFCDEWLMIDTSNLPILGAVSFIATMFAAWSLGYRDTTFVLIVVTGTLPLWFFVIFLVGILIPPRLWRFEKVAWFTYDNRYSPAIWAGSFVVGIVITFSVGYYKESLIENAMFIFVVACTTLLIGFVGNYVVGRLIPLPPNQAKGDSFNSAGSLCLTDKSETDKKINP
jgi:hypothetical protein